MAQHGAKGDSERGRMTARCRGREIKTSSARNVLGKYSELGIAHTTKDAMSNPQALKAGDAGRRPSPGSKPRKRNAGRTREAILSAAEAEFSNKGFNGARMEQIARRSRSNMRMIYHYFKSKENLYVACLERIYLKVRTAEGRLDLRNEEPLEGMAKLVTFTFRHLLDNPEFVRLIMNENLLRGRYLRRSELVPALTLHLLDALRDLLHRGERLEVFRRGIDPVHLYITILGVSNIHLSNRYTLSAMFQTDLADPAWLEERCAHARAVILAYLRA